LPGLAGFLQGGITVSAYHEEHWAQIRAKTADRKARFAERCALQERLHAADPARYSLTVPVDDEEFPDESYTAGWGQEEPDEPELGYILWDDEESDDAATWLN
jgi:hypothetical protein